MRHLQLHNSDQLSETIYECDKHPPYAILSHTWGANDEEVISADVKYGNGKSKAGYAKLLFCGEQALKDDFRRFWVDLCYVDVSSSLVHSEAINSIFRWYSNAEKCLVYLQDVSALKVRLQWSHAVRLVFCSLEEWLVHPWLYVELEWKVLYQSNLEYG
jgi:hypothetical protein